MALTCENLIAGWRACGAVGDVPLIVHSSLSRLGKVYGGAATVVQSLLAVTPTLVVPAFRNAPMGAGSAYIEAMSSALLSSHPVVPVAAVGVDAAAIVRTQPLACVLGAGSPFDVMYSLGGQILLSGVDHTRSSFLHHCEALTPSPRPQKRVIRPELVVTTWLGTTGGSFPLWGGSSRRRSSPFTG